MKGCLKAQMGFQVAFCHTGYLKPATMTHTKDQNNDRVGFTCRYWIYGDKFYFLEINGESHFCWLVIVADE